MANTKTTQLPELTVIQNEDWIYVIDKSDLTDGLEGTSKKISKFNLSLNGVQFIANTEIASYPTGDVYTLVTEAKTYTDWGGIVVGANKIAILMRIDGVFSSSQNTLVLTDYVLKTDVVNTLVSTETEKPLSAAQGKALNEKNIKIEPWTAKSYLSGDQVNYIGKDWVSNAATVAGDVPGTSTKWVERLSADQSKADLEAGKNKYNVATSESGYFIDAAGVQISNASYVTSKFIPVIALSQYTSNLSIRFVNYYDVNKTFVIGGPSVASTTFTPPLGVAYVKISINTTISNPNLLQLEIGSVPSTKEDFKYIVKPDQLELREYVKKENLETELIGKVPLLTSGTNFFNKVSATIGSFIDATGAILPNATYDYSDYIPVIALSQYTSNFNMRFVSYYDASKVFVAGGPTAFTTTFTPPIGVAFVRVTFFHVNINNFMLIKGTTLPPVYLAYKEKVVSNESLEIYSSKIIKDVPADTFKLFLPKEVCIAVGRTIELYHNEIAWCGNINDYHFLWSGVGKSMKRKWSCTGVTIGTNVLTLKVYDKNNILIATKTTNVRVVSATISSPFTIAAIADSLGNQKPWNAEVRTLSSNTISFVGTRNSGTSEGRSGATSSYYLGNNSYTFDALGIAGIDGRTQDLNPFFNPVLGDVDFAYYKSNYAQNPDKLIIWLGTNGIAVDPTSNATNIKTFIDKIRATGGATIPIFVVHTLFRGNQDGIGKQLGVDGYVVNSTYKLEEDLKVFNLQEKLLSDLTGYSNLYLVPVSTCHDSEFNFGAVSTPVNPRASQVEFLPVEATHPQTQGYMQIADIIFSSLAANQ